MTPPKNKSLVAASSPPLKKVPVAAKRAAAPVKNAAARKVAPPRETAPITVTEKWGKKEKRVRASVSIPEAQFVALAELKARCLRLGMNAKKGEVLAAGIQLLWDLPETTFEASMLPYLRADNSAKNGKMRQR